MNNSEISKQILSYELFKSFLNIQKGHYKCLKLLYDAGLDMYEEDIENMTPYELAIMSNNLECKNFVIESLKPANENKNDYYNIQLSNQTTDNSGKYKQLFLFTVKNNLTV